MSYRISLTTAPHSGGTKSYGVILIENKTKELSAMVTFWGKTPAGAFVPKARGVKNKIACLHIGMGAYEKSEILSAKSKKGYGPWVSNPDDVVEHADLNARLAKLFHPKDVSEIVTYFGADLKLSGESDTEPVLAETVVSTEPKAPVVKPESWGTW